MSASAPRRLALGLSGKLMLLTLGFVMLAEVLIFLPSIANFRTSYLRDRVAAAQTAALVIEAAPAEAVPETLVQRLLDNVGARLIALKIGGTRRLIALDADVPAVRRDIDVRVRNLPREIADSFSTMFSRGDSMIRVLGAAPMGGEFLELIMPEAPLRRALLSYAGAILLSSLLLSFSAGAVVYAALYALIVRPVQRLSQSFDDFEHNTARIIKPSQRGDEIGDAERKLAAMQTALNQQITQQSHLANVGLAVAKINHDLRNLLSSAHLLSDRIARVADPTVQRIAPKLIAALDRAVNFCQATLAYGKAEERPPKPRSFDLRRLVLDLRDLLGLDEGGNVRLIIDMPERMIIKADPEQLLRVLMNMARNSLEAMAALDGEKELRIAARRSAEWVEIDLCDTGPGIPRERQETLFRPFSASRTPGGTGLGLTIADELMRAQGGGIRLIESAAGTCFRLTLPA